MIFPSSSCEKVFLSSLSKHEPCFSLIVKHSRSSNRQQHRTTCGCKLQSHAPHTERTQKRRENRQSSSSSLPKGRQYSLLPLMQAPLCHSGTSILPLSMPPTPTSCWSSCASLLARSPALSTRLHVRRTCALCSARFEDLGFRVYCPLRT